MRLDDIKARVAAATPGPWNTYRAKGIDTYRGHGNIRT